MQIELFFFFVFNWHDISSPLLDQVVRETYSLISNQNGTLCMDAEL